MELIFPKSFHYWLHTLFNRNFVYLELLEANLPSIEPPNNQEVASATDQGHLAQKLILYPYPVNTIKIKIKTATLSGRRLTEAPVNFLAVSLLKKCFLCIIEMKPVQSDAHCVL